MADMLPSLQTLTYDLILDADDIPTSNEPGVNIRIGGVVYQAQCPDFVQMFAFQEEINDAEDLSAFAASWKILEMCLSDADLARLDQRITATTDTGERSKLRARVALAAKKLMSHYGPAVKRQMAELADAQED
jgi:hypothetical protein